MSAFKPNPDNEFDSASALDYAYGRNAEIISAARRVATKPHRDAAEVAARILASNERRREQARQTLINTNYSPLIRLKARLDQDANFQHQRQRMVEDTFTTFRVYNNLISTQPEVRALESMKTINSAYILAARVDYTLLPNSIAGMYRSILKNRLYGSMGLNVLQDLARFPMKNVDIASLQRSMTNLASIIRWAQASHYLPKDWSRVTPNQGFADMIPETATWPSAMDTMEDLSLLTLEDLTDQIGALTVALILWVRNGGSVITARKLFSAFIITYTVYMSVSEGVNTTVEFMENLQHFYELLRDE